MQLFSKEQAPRKPRIKRMHVVDAGGDCGTMVEMKCYHCNYESGWFSTDEPIRQLKRGLPCPKCNEQTK
jgi:hypothetical protein